MIKLIIGLGNIGTAYQDTRHNAGFWFVETLTEKFNIHLADDKKFHGQVGRGTIYGHDIHLLLPNTLMNRSGLAVAPMAKFYNIRSDEILIAHDELDIAAGNIRLKKGADMVDITDLETLCHILVRIFTVCALVLGVQSIHLR